MAHISEVNSNKVTVLLDGNSVAYRAFFKAPPLMANGIQTGVIHVFLAVLGKLAANPAVGSIVAVFDAKGKNRRHELLESYKATRQAMPEDLIVQIEALKEIIPSMGIPLYSVSGYEADDVINTLAEKNNGPVWLVTKDKDLHQLVSDKVKVYDYQNDVLIDRQGVFEKFGLYPENILDMLALAGDTSDNIPGVAGVGIKTAQILIEKYATLECIFENIAEIKGKLQEKLIIGKDNAFLSRELAKLMWVDDLQPAETLRNEAKLKAFYEKYKLKYHLKRLEDAKDGKSDIDIKESADDENLDDSGGFTGTIPILESGTVEKAELIAFVDGEVYAVGGGFYEIIEKARESTYYFDLKHLYRRGMVGRGQFMDILLASWLIDPDSGGLKKSKTETIALFLSRINAYASYATDKLKELELEELYYKMELPVTYIIADAETQGILIDVDKIKETSIFLKQEINKIIANINNRANSALNPNSPKQLGVYLYDTLGLKPLKKNKRGYSTDEETLLDLRDTYPEKGDILDDILKYRELNKLSSTYSENLLDFRLSDGRIHTDFKQTGTSTGRLSSVNPNLQNIPQQSGPAGAIRSAFIASLGKSFVSIDYSQIELRILAHLSGDERLIESFMKGIDIHSVTARTIFHLEQDSQVPDDLRRIAKAVNFGILYGLSPYGLARDTKVSASEAKVFIERYFGLYQKVGSFIADTIAETKEKGYCRTILGRKRLIKDIDSHNGNIRQRAERMAVNAPIQGSAADIIKLAMIECDKYIKESGANARLILQIHDELLFEVNDEEAVNFAAEASKVMERVFTMDVPLSVNSAVGKNWGDL